MPDSPDSKKLYELSFEYRPQYLFVVVKGEKDSYEISMQYWKEVADECARTGIKKVLIEEDLVEGISVHDTYRLASAIPQFGFFGVRVAFVDLHAEQENANQFGETVATNRGLLVRVFNNFADGEKWLLGG